MTRRLVEGYSLKKNISIRNNVLRPIRIIIDTSYVLRTVRLKRVD